MMPRVVRFQPSRCTVSRHLLTVALLPLVFACGEPYPSTPPAPPSAPATPAPTPPIVSKEVAEIFLADADGTVRGRLTEGSWPSWSPDGRQIVFERNSRVLVIDADGSNEKLLVQGRWPAWSPDGRRIAFVADQAIRVMDADGTSVRKLLSPTVNMFVPSDDVGLLAWSPDGAYIAFETLSLINYAKIVLVSADGTGEHRLTSPVGEAGAAEEDGPAWSPDGSRLVFWSTGVGLSTVDRNGGDRRPLVSESQVGFYSRPAWSPDGRMITFTSLDRSSILVIPSGGGVTTVFIQDGMQAAWSPDGKRLAFVRIRER